MQIDMHTHTTFSDGTKTPEELVKHAKDMGLRVIAITDHDTAGGLKRGQNTAQKLGGITVVNGVELSAVSLGETHILGYFIDPEETHFNQVISEVQGFREKRFYQTLELIEKQGMVIHSDDLLKYGEPRNLGRVHFAKALMEKGYVKSIDEGFQKYLGRGKPCCPKKQRLAAEDAIAAIRSAGGDAYLAHLHLTGLAGRDLFRYVKELKQFGLSGLEGYYTDYTPAMQDAYQSMAHELGLKISGGSDFHGDNKPNIEIGRGYGNLNIPYAVYEQMRNGR